MKADNWTILMDTIIWELFLQIMGKYLNKYKTGSKIQVTSTIRSVTL